jgi:hypothetical protein
MHIPRRKPGVAIFRHEPEIRPEPEVLVHREVW